MMNVKNGVRTSSTAVQRSNMAVDDRQTVGAEDRAKAFGTNDNIGETLNKLTDPNFVDQSKARHVGNPNLDKDAFMKLMLAQMKNQDPANPMQSHEMAAQLAQFTSVEQLQNINTTLEGMKATQGPQTNYQALNFIGKMVSGDTSRLTRVQGDKEHDFNYELLGDAQQVEVSVKDAEGTTIRKLNIPNQKKGANSIRWNGVADDGSITHPGEYHFAVEAKSSDGKKIGAKTEFSGKITGLNYTASGPILLVGNQSVRMQDVKKITEPLSEDAAAAKTPATRLAPPDAASIKDKVAKALAQQPRPKPAPPASLKMLKPQEETPAAPVAEAVPREVTPNIQKVAMSKNVYDQVNGTGTQPSEGTP